MCPKTASAKGSDDLVFASMNFSDTACYQAMKTRDARFDGRFFVGVTSTKIYCRPVCRVRIPLRKNCTFHPSAAAAEAHGFRPCMKCRPELAPGFSTIDGPRLLARAAARLIEETIAQDVDLEHVADRVGVTLFAKRLLTDTRMPVTEVAYASGFSSLRRMNALFAARYRFPPMRLRKNAQSLDVSPVSSPDAAFRFTVPYRAPYDWWHILAFLETRAIPGVESIAGGQYARVLRMNYQDSATKKTKELVSWILVRNLHGKSALEVQISPAFAPVLSQVLTLAKRVFDVHADPNEIAECLGRLSKCDRGLRLPGAWDGFELAVRAILGQQVTVKAARTIATRLVRAFGEPLAADALPGANLCVAFPLAKTIAALDVSQLASLGLPASRAQAILSLAASVACGKLSLSPSFNADPEQLIAKLQAMQGIGAWTAQYIAMRALSWPDAWLPRDVVLQKALKLPCTAQGDREAKSRAEQWRPWRSYAVMHLWNSH
jgi:AraC family transcriptional regulator, regulatory protein of adaptative response / DNA-3-methyladenine glycosylase II